jgi:biopolymer transport protein TolQ
LLSWAVIVKKYFEFKKIKKMNNIFYEYYSSSYSLEDTYQQAKASTGSTYAFLYRKTHENLKKLISKESFQDEESLTKAFDRKRVVILSVVERTLQQNFSQIIENLESGLSILASIASLTVFVGLFGTVWGIINSFKGLATGGGSIEVIAPGIAEALVATAIGLAVAIPAGLFFNIFSNMISKLSGSMERFSQDYLNLIESDILE